MDRDSEIEATMLRLVAERGADKTVCPSEVARALGGRDDWRSLMQPVRRVAVRLAGQGKVAILRKGLPVADPETMRGVYRLGMPRAGATPDLHGANVGKGTEWRAAGSPPPCGEG